MSGELTGLKISQLARLAGVHPMTLRNYEKRGILSPPRDVNNHRRYTQADLEKLKAILKARWPNEANES